MSKSGKKSHYTTIQMPTTLVESIKKLNNISGLYRSHHEAIINFTRIQLIKYIKVIRDAKRLKVRFKNESER